MIECIDLPAITSCPPGDCRPKNATPIRTGPTNAGGARAATAEGRRGGVSLGGSIETNRAPKGKKKR